MAESDIQEALRVLSRKPHSKVAPIARHFGVPARTLLRRIQGHSSPYGHIPANRALNDVEEAILQGQITQFDAMGLHMRRTTLVNAANNILASQRGPEQEPRIVDAQWARRWLSRHPEVRQIKQKPIELARKEAEQPELIRDWLLRTYKKIDELGVDLCDLWNMDETGFQIGMARTQWILTRDPKRLDEYYLASDTDRESCTVIKCVSAAGSVIDPFLILKGKTILAGWFRDESLPSNTVFAVSESGWTNDELGLTWLKHFDQRTKKTQSGAWRMLVLDNHTSHESWEFANYAIEHKIYLWGLPSHTSHLLQPLDLAVFGPFKHWHSEAVDAATRLGCTKFNKIEFIHHLNAIRTNTFKKGTIRRGWLEAGIYPRNPGAVIDYIRPTEPQKPQSYEVEPHSDEAVASDTSSSAFLPEFTPPRPLQGARRVPLTPRTPKSLIRLAKACENDIHALTGDILVQQRFGKLQKGARIQAGMNVQAQGFLKETEAALIGRSRRQKGPGNLSHVQKGGHIVGSEARSIAKEKLAIAAEKAEKIAALHERFERLKREAYESRIAKEGCTHEETA